MPAKAKKTPMSAAHKEALAEGREQSRVVRDYLDALEAHKPKRGRKRTTESVKKNLTEQASGTMQALEPNSAKQLASLRHVVGSALDRAGLPGILGTVAGDDTILVVTAQRVGGARVARQLSGLAGL